MSAIETTAGQFDLATFLANNRASVEAIRERLEAATPGPWSVWRTDGGQPAITSDAEGFDHVAHVDDDADAEFIANAIDDVGHLLELLDACYARVSHG